MPKVMEFESLPVLGYNACFLRCRPETVGNEGRGRERHLALAFDRREDEIAFARIRGCFVPVLQMVGKKRAQRYIATLY
jgi:hypothetical protein